MSNTPDPVPGAAAPPPAVVSAVSSIAANLGAVGVLAWLCLVQMPARDAQFLAALDKQTEAIQAVRQSQTELLAEIRAKRLNHDFRSGSDNQKRP